VTEPDETLGGVLGFEERFGEPLRERLRQLAAAWPLPGDRLRSSAVGQAVDRVRDVFSTPLYKVLAAAWRRHPACQAFCDPSQHPPGEVSTVELAEHTLEWMCEPAVEILAEGLAAAGMGRLAELDFQVRVEGTVRAGVLTIRDARFIRMEAADLVLAASLGVEGFTVARCEVPLRFPGALRFGEHGEPICPEPEPVAEPPAEARSAAPGRIAVPALLDPVAQRSADDRSVVASISDDVDCGSIG